MLLALYCGAEMPMVVVRDVRDVREVMCIVV